MEIFPCAQIPENSGAQLGNEIARVLEGDDTVYN